MTAAATRSRDGLCCTAVVLLKPSVIVCLQPSAFAAYLLPLLELSEHDNRVTFPLPHHPPEILHCVWKRALRGNEVVLLSVALSHRKTDYFSCLGPTMCIHSNTFELFQEERHLVIKCSYIYKRCVDVICELLTPSHGENDSVEVI